MGCHKKQIWLIRCFGGTALEATRPGLAGGPCPAAARCARTRRTPGTAVASLRDPTVGPQPTPKSRPEPFQGVDVHLAEPVPVVVPGELPRRVADGAVCVAPLGEPGVDVILVGVNDAPRGDPGLDQRADC